MCDLYDETLKWMNSFQNRDCLCLCFMHIIQRELNTLVHEWNTHRVRPSRNCSLPGGIPDELFFLPQIQGMVYMQEKYYQLLYYSI